MHVTILISTSKGTSKKVSVELPVVLGRSPDVGLSVVHPAISREHCEISESAGFVKIRDLGSTNGTRVGGKKVPEAILRPHGKFSIGPINFQVDYHYVGEATQYISEPEDEDDGEDLATSGKSNLIRHGFPTPKPADNGGKPDDWLQSDEVYGLKLEESDSPAAAPEATPPSSVIPRMTPAARPAQEPRRGDFLRTPKAPSQRLTDAPAAPEKASGPQREPKTNPPAANASRAAKPPRKQPSAAPAPAVGEKAFDLERDLEELLDGLQGIDLNEFLKGIN